MKPTPRLLMAGLLASLSPSLALATNGYFANGYGTQSEGIAGISIALPQDSLTSSANPAGVALVGDRVDAGIDVFQPDRSASISGNAYGLDGQYSGNSTKDFYIPNFGYTHQLSPTLGFGVAVYGNGGMNTDYDKNPFGGNGSAGVDFSQLFVSPALAWKPNDSNSLGIGVNLAYQEFSAKGLDGFANSELSSSPSNVTSNQHDHSTGWGVRLGWIGQLSPDLTAGVTWASRTHMGKFDQYRGLFADQGEFDVPENYGAGLSYKATPTLTLATEYERILYSKISSVGDPIDGLLLGQQLGSSGGPGFGWKNINIYRIGALYDWSDSLTLRAGFSHADQPIPDSQAMFNILAPGVVQDHATLGATWKVGQQGEFSLAYVHGFKKTITGNNAIPNAFGGGSASISLSENLVGISYGWKF